MTSVRSSILEKLSAINLSLDVDSLSEFDNFIEVAVCDSTGFLELIMSLEDEFAISFNASDFNKTGFYTLIGLEEVIEKKIRLKNVDS